MLYRNPGITGRYNLTTRPKQNYPDSRYRSLDISPKIYKYLSIGKKITHCLVDVKGNRIKLLFNGYQLGWKISGYRLGCSKALNGIKRFPFKTNVYKIRRLKGDRAEVFFDIPAKISKVYRD